jgi:hypothetical protein
MRRESGYSFNQPHHAQDRRKLRIRQGKLGASSIGGCISSRRTSEKSLGGLQSPGLNSRNKSVLNSPRVSEQNAPRPAMAAGRRVLRAALLALVVVFLFFAGILYLFNRSFSANPEPVSASRLTTGNLLFPVQVAVFPERVARYKPRFFGHTEDSISTDLIASVKVQAGVVFADVVLDTAGGSPPIVIHGLWKKDAERLRELIGAAQEARRKRAK